VATTWTLDRVRTLVAAAQEEITMRDDVEAANKRRELYEEMLFAVIEREPFKDRARDVLARNTRGVNVFIELFMGVFREDPVTAPVVDLWWRASVESIGYANQALDGETVDDAIVRIALHAGAAGTLPARLLATSRALRRDNIEDAEALLDEARTRARDLPAGDVKRAQRVAARVANDPAVRRRYALEELHRLLDVRGLHEIVCRGLESGKLTDEHSEVRLWKRLLGLPLRPLAEIETYLQRVRALRPRLDAA
jgi:hypothetical protein